MTREFRLMLAEQGAADPELMGAGVSAGLPSPAEEMRPVSQCGLPNVQCGFPDCVGKSCVEDRPAFLAPKAFPADPRDAEIARLRAALWEIVGSGGRHTARIARAALAQSGEAK
jgi:hypothetical protein